MPLALKIPDILLTIFLSLFGQEMLVSTVECFESFGADCPLLRLRLMALFSPDVIVWGWRWRCRCCLCCSFEDGDGDDGDGGGGDDGGDDDGGDDKDDDCPSSSSFFDRAITSKPESVGRDIRRCISAQTSAEIIRRDIRCREHQKNPDPDPEPTLKPKSKFEPKIKSKSRDRI